METPSFEFIKNHFKNAKIVSSAYFRENFNIKEYDFNSLYESNGCIYIISRDNEWTISLFDTERGLAIINK